MADIFFVYTFLCFDRRLRILLNEPSFWRHIIFSPALYAILHVKRVKNWHTSHQFNKHSIHYPHQPAQSMSLCFSYCFFSVCCYKCWHIFIHCDDDNVRCYYAMQIARPVQQANKTTPNQNKHITKKEPKQTNSVWIADCESMKYQISQRHRLERVEKSK